jgi:hypothetical protein
VLVDPDGEDYVACDGGSCSPKNDTEFAAWGNDLLASNYQIFGNSQVGVVLTRDGQEYGRYFWFNGGAIGPVRPASGDSGPVQRLVNAGIGWLKGGALCIHEALVGDSLDPVDLAIRRFLQPSNRRQEAGANASVLGSIILLPGLAKNLAKEALALRKQLASEPQMAELLHSGGRPIFGAGTNRQLNDAARLSKQYGGNADGWAKVRSSSYRAPDGTIFEIHAYRNVATGRVVEMKTVIDKWGTR